MEAKRKLTDKDIKDIAKKVKDSLATENPIVISDFMEEFDMSDEDIQKIIRKIL